jgi:hypothetical protein
MATALVDPPVVTQAPDPAVPAAGRACTRLRALLRRWAVLPPEPAEAEQQRVLRLEEARGVLERARALVADGWVQDAFYVVRDSRGQLRPVSPFGLLTLSRTEVAGTCLVGAVAHAASDLDRRHRRDPAALAVDTLWAAAVERADWTGGRHLVDRAHPAARSARVRDLAAWNDESGRRREDVLGLLDGAISRTILAAVR